MSRIDFGDACQFAELFAEHTDRFGNLGRAFLALYRDDGLPARDQLTARQHEILLFIAESLDVRGYAPSFEEIAARFGYSTLATVHEHLANLQRKGWIEREYNQPRAITIRRFPTDTGIPEGVA